MPHGSRRAPSQAPWVAPRSISSAMARAASISWTMARASHHRSNSGPMQCGKIPKSTRPPMQQERRRNGKCTRPPGKHSAPMCATSEPAPKPWPWPWLWLRPWPWPWRWPWPWPWLGCGAFYRVGQDMLRKHIESRVFTILSRSHPIQHGPNGSRTDRLPSPSPFPRLAKRKEICYRRARVHL